jgi:hypothetical protein
MLQGATGTGRPLRIAPRQGALSSGLWDSAVPGRARGGSGPRGPGQCPPVWQGPGATAAKRCSRERRRRPQPAGRTELAPVASAAAARVALPTIDAAAAQPKNGMRDQGREMSLPLAGDGCQSRPRVAALWQIVQASILRHLTFSLGCPPYAYLVLNRVCCEAVGR